PTSNHQSPIGNRQLAIGNKVMETLLKDLRYGIRSLLKQPGFAFVAVLSIALGIGVNTTIFSFVNAALFRPLPFADSERLVRAWVGNWFSFLNFVTYL